MRIHSYARLAMLAKTSPAMKLPVVLCLCLAAGVPFPAGAQQDDSTAAALVTKFSYCTVTDMEDHKIWASPVFEFSYEKNAEYTGPTGNFHRVRGLETEFHQRVSAVGGAGTKSCWAGSDTRAEVETQRSQRKAEWTKRVFLWASEWQDVPFTPKAWSPESAVAAVGAAPATVAKYFHCQATDVNAGTSVLTQAFERGVSTADIGHAFAMAGEFTKEFKAKVLPVRGLSDPLALCEFSDTLAEANKKRAEFRNLLGGWTGTDMEDVAWQPTVRVEPRAAATPTPAVAQAPAAPPAAATTAAVPSAAPASQGAIEAQIDSLSASSAQALGLDAPQGALVVAVTPGGAADKAGLKPLDVIVEIAGQPVKDAADFAAVVARMRPGYKAPLRIKRNRTLKDLSVKIAAAPVSALSGAAAPVTAPVAPASTFVRGWAGWTTHPAAISTKLATVLGIDRGVMLTGIVPDGAAARAGLQPFDVVVALNGRAVNSAAEMTTQMATMQAGSELSVTVWRKEAETDIKVTLSATQPWFVFPQGSTGYCWANSNRHALQLTWASTVFGVPTFSPDTRSATSQQLSEQFRAFLLRHLPSFAVGDPAYTFTICTANANVTTSAPRSSQTSETIEVLWAPPI